MCTHKEEVLFAEQDVQHDHAYPSEAGLGCISEQHKTHELIFAPCTCQRAASYKEHADANEQADGRVLAVARGQHLPRSRHGVAWHKQEDCLQIRKYAEQ